MQSSILEFSTVKSLLLLLLLSLLLYIIFLFNVGDLFNTRLCQPDCAKRIVSCWWLPVLRAVDGYQTKVLCSSFIGQTVIAINPAVHMLDLGLNIPNGKQYGMLEDCCTFFFFFFLLLLLLFIFIFILDWIRDFNFDATGAIVDDQSYNTKRN